MDGAALEAAVVDLAARLRVRVHVPGMARRTPDGVAVELYGVDRRAYPSTPAGDAELRADVLEARAAFLRARWEALAERRERRDHLAEARRVLDDAASAAADRAHRAETADERAARWKAHHKAEAACARAEREEAEIPGRGEFWTTPTE